MGLWKILKWLFGGKHTYAKPNDNLKEHAVENRTCFSQGKEIVCATSVENQPVRIATTNTSDAGITGNEDKTNKRSVSPPPKKTLPTFEVRDVPVICCYKKDLLYQKTRQDHDHILNWLKNLLSENKSLPFANLATDGKGGQVLRVFPSKKAGNFWFLGDIHGDLLSFVTAIDTVKFFSGTEELGEPTIILLGDLFDRLHYDYEVLVYLLDCMRRGERFIWIAGNHDIIQYDETSQRFIAGVSPSELCDWLNSEEKIEKDKKYHANARELMILLTKIIPTLPKAIYFPDGTLAAHGAVPHNDISPSIEIWEDLSKENVLSDFTWCRLHPTKAMTAVNRSSKGCQMGIREFNQFCNMMKTKLNSPVRAFIRGHDHHPERYKHYEKYDHALVLTINTISCTLDGCDPFGQAGYVTKPAIIQYLPGTPISDGLANCGTTDGSSTEQQEPRFIVHCLKFRRKDIEEWYPNPSKNKC